MGPRPLWLVGHIHDDPNVQILAMDNMSMINETTFHAEVLTVKVEKVDVTITTAIVYYWPLVRAGEDQFAVEKEKHAQEGYRRSRIYTIDRTRMTNDRTCCTYCIKSSGSFYF